MPELPEVETVVRGLHARLAGSTLTALRIFQPQVIESDARAFRRAAQQVRVQAVRRRGKWIRIELANGQTVLAHLRMTGRLTVVDASTPRERHDHVEWQIDSGPEQLRFNDPRRFGRFRLIPTADVEAYLAARGFGPEPFEVDAAELARRIGRGRRSIKAALLDQSVVAGIGNIYADETLFRAGIDPRLATARLGPVRVRRIHTAMHAVLAEAIEAHGTTLRNYAAPDGQSGRYQFQLSVFRRTGSPCPVCGRSVRKVRLAGRSTHFCPGCQKR